ncbi:MAG: DNA primase [Actinomycetota bacterium]
MAIVDEDIQRVRAETDAVAVIGAHVGLRRVGRRQVGLCPFHNEKSPSFSVNAEEGLYYCFGCGASGDIISFVQQVEGLDFRSAVELLAERAGITLRYTEEGTADRRRRSSEVHELLEEAVEFYHQRLLTGADGGVARSYLRSRGYDGDTVREFRIGWAPDAWEELLRALRGKPRELLADAGLVAQNDNGRLRDAFRARVMFPIFDVAGRPIGFGGRILPGGRGPKYKNSSQGPVYDKSRVLYGLNWAKQSAVQRGRLVVCEGYTDVIGFARAGITEAVATCGTSLTEDHVKTMRRFARRIVLAFDADAAGQGAAERVYAWEQAHDLEVEVVELGEGRDPGDVAASDPEALVAAVDGAKPFLGWRVDRILAGATDRPERRARAAHAALDAIREHPDAFVRDQYVMTVADRCGLDPDQLRADVGRRGRRVAVAEPVEMYVEELPELEPSELEALRVLAHRPEAIAHRLHAGLFPSPAGSGTYRALVAGGGSVRAATDQADPALHPVLSRIAVEESEAEPDDVVRLLARLAAQDALTRLSRRGDAGDPNILELRTWLKGRIDELNDVEHCAPTVALLSDWLQAHEDAA